MRAISQYVIEEMEKVGGENWMPVSLQTTQKIVSDSTTCKWEPMRSVLASGLLERNESRIFRRRHLRKRTVRLFRRGSARTGRIHRHLEVRVSEARRDSCVVLRCNRRPARLPAWDFSPVLTTTVHLTRLMFPCSKVWPLRFQRALGRGPGSARLGENPVWAPHYKL